SSYSSSCSYSFSSEQLRIFLPTGALPLVAVLEVEQAAVGGVGAADGVPEELAAPQVAVAGQDVGVLGQVEVVNEVQLLADVVAGPTGRVEPHHVAARLVQRVALVREPERVGLDPHRQPLGRVQVQVEVQVLNVLPADQVDPPEVIVAEREQLV